ncbi:MAG TPA: VWA domain-containing protein [Kofleriaceae bacterium]
MRLPQPGQIGIAFKSTTRVEARVPVQVQGQVNGQVEVAAPVQETHTLVPLQGAPVVEFFGVPLDGAQDVVFVLDCSGSMSNAARGRMAQLQAAPPAPPEASPVDAANANPPPPPADPSAPPDTQQPAPPPAPVQLRKIDVAQAELVDALQRLPVGTRMNVLFFNSDLDAYAPGVVQLDEASRADLIAFVKETEPAGSTALAPAMRTAFMMSARRVVLLSDGLGNVGGNADAVLRDAREAIHGGVRIDTIGVGSGQDSQLLGALANESGGLYQAL